MESPKRFPNTESPFRALENIIISNINVLQCADAIPEFIIPSE
jgi:hypothetical protein